MPLNRFLRNSETTASLTIFKTVNFIKIKFDFYNILY